MKIIITAKILIAIARRYVTYKGFVTLLHSRKATTYQRMDRYTTE